MSEIGKLIDFIRQQAICSRCEKSIQCKGPIPEMKVYICADRFFCSRGRFDEDTIQCLIKTKNMESL